MCHIVQILSQIEGITLPFYFMLDIFYDKKKEERHGFFWLFNHSMQEKYRTLGAYIRLQTPERALFSLSTFHT